jgi:hypothetical protein
MVKGTDVPATREDPLVVVLPPANGVRIRLRARDGSAASDCLLAWRGSRELFGDAGGIPDELHWYFGNASVAWQQERRSHTFSHKLGCDAHGTVTLHSIVPDLEGALVVVDCLGTELLQHKMTTPPLGDVQDLDLEIPAEPRRIHGRVVDADGRPASQVALELWQATDGPRASTRSRGDGLFAFPAVYSDGPLRLLARRSGLGTSERDLGPAALDADLVLTLTASRRITIAVLDDLGTAVPGLRPEVHAGTQERVDVQQTGNGEYTCTDLPVGQVTISCLLGGRRFELGHDTADPRAELRVPRPARATICAPDGWPQPELGYGLIAALTPVTPFAEPVRTELSKPGDPPKLFLPGRYRIALETIHWNYREQRTDYAEQGPAAEVELRAGETTDVHLR